MPVIISSILSIISSIVGGVTEDQKAKIALELQQNQNFADLLKAQADIDANEATNPSLFVAGWRPAVGWVCAAAFAWAYLVAPIIAYSCTISGHPVALPSLNITDMLTVLMGMLGLGGMRSWEKINNVSNNH